MRRLLYRSLLPAACMVTLLASAGCGNACMDLAKQVCACLPDDGTRAACNQRAQEAASNYDIRAQDQQFCQHQIDTGACDCNMLIFPEGQKGCGLSYSSAPQGGSTPTSP